MDHKNNQDVKICPGSKIRNQINNQNNPTNNQNTNQNKKPTQNQYNNFQ
jgi:hypothetical protein